MKKPATRQTKTCCDRCGSCCKQGGPALHTQDKHLLDNGFLQREQLITIRQGELAFQPFSHTPEPVNNEFLKLAGSKGSWCCQFYDNDAAACTLYGNRPVACGLFDCTAPEALLAITGKHLLSRHDIIAQDDPMRPLVTEHEQRCPCPDLVNLSQKIANNRNTTRTTLGNLVSVDLNLRARATRSHGLSVEQEMFYFGRPLFQLLQPLGITVTDTPQGIALKLP